MNSANHTRVARELLRFSLPLIMSGVLQQLYSWADAFIIGHAEGQMQLAAVGATTSASMFLTNTILGLTLGLSIMAAQHVGRGSPQRIRVTLASFLPLMCGGYALLAATAALFLRGILTTLGTPPEIFLDALSYLRILLLGVPFLACYNLYATLLRALATPRPHSTPFRSLPAQMSRWIFSSLRFCLSALPARLLPPSFPKSP